VGNHGPLGFDTPLLVHAVYRDVGRIVRPLADSLLFTNPVGRRMARMTASVEARPEHALVLLRAGEWVLVYPGGARETMRGADERYQLSWQGRLGFARVAIEAGAPVVPVACVGTDDLFRQVVDRERMAKTLAGRLTERLLGPAYVPPLYVPRLRRTQFHYTFGEPIATECFAGAGDDGARRLQEQAAASLSALLEQGRKVRRDKLGR
jgi:1-acyl-sn-glycerol-3-phosphate acyltransferase